MDLSTRKDLSTRMELSTKKELSTRMELSLERIDMKLFLASASPRRFEIMKMMDFEFEVYVPEFDERTYEQEVISRGISNIKEITKEVAKGKAMSAYEQLKPNFPNEEIAIISADTIVVLDGVIFGKGQNREKSIEMLSKLNNNMHEVISAVWILGDVPETSILNTSKVYFANSSKELIEKYVDEYRPFDKAGAYGIQDGGALLIEKIEGNYHNIMGLPLRDVYNSLTKLLPH